jgi:hypothetical protein
MTLNYNEIKGGKGILPETPLGTVFQFYYART